MSPTAGHRSSATGIGGTKALALHSQCHEHVNRSFRRVVYDSLLCSSAEKMLGYRLRGRLVTEDLPGPECRDRCMGGLWRPSEGYRHHHCELSKPLPAARHFVFQASEPQSCRMCHG